MIFIFYVAWLATFINLNSSALTLTNTTIQTTSSYSNNFNIICQSGYDNSLIISSTNIFYGNSATRPAASTIVTYMGYYEFLNNSGAEGGGIRIINCQGFLLDNKFEENQANEGGAIFFDGKG